MEKEETIKNFIVYEEKSIKDTMRRIDENSFGIAFTADDNERFTGLVTDGDIRRAILKGVPIEEKVKTIANKTPITLQGNEKIDEMAEALDKEKIAKAIHRLGNLKVPVINPEGRVSDIMIISFKGGKLAYESLFESSDTNLKNGCVKNVLVIGGAGYIGSVLTRKLLERGYNVRVFDNLLYGDEGVKELCGHQNFEMMSGDMRSMESVIEAIKGMDAVILLAALVGDPASSLNPQKTLEINYHSTKMIAEICKYYQINRFIFASSCSLYGKNDDIDRPLTEESPMNPLSLYARTKIESEKAVLNSIDENFSPTIFRMATIYGLSPRMRFDLVVNILAAKAQLEKQITIFGGEQYRPVIHVSDAADAYIKCLEAPIEKVRGKIFNLGSNSQNYRIKEIGELVKECMPEAEIKVQADKEDERSYRVSFDEIKRVLGFEANVSVQDAVKEIKEAIERGRFKDYTAKEYSNYKMLSVNP